MNMPRITVILGSLLVAIGLIGYFATGMVSVTALIPAFFGIVLMLLGLFATTERRRKHLMHTAAVLAVLGLFGSASGIPGAISLAIGGEVAMPAATISRAVMALLLIGYVILAVMSFIQARRNRQPGIS